MFVIIDGEHVAFVSREVEARVGVEIMRSANCAYSSCVFIMIVDESDVHAELSLLPNLEKTRVYMRN